MINIKRQIKRKKLIRKLFKILKDEVITYNPNNVKIKFRINEKINFTSSNNNKITAWDNMKTKKLELCNITLNLYAYKNRYKKGYIKDTYYQGRERFLNKYVLHNRKNALKFILLHELGHCKIVLHNKWRKNIPYIEKLADRIAIKYLTKQKGIK